MTGPSFTSLFFFFMDIHFTLESSFKPSFRWELQYFQVIDSKDGKGEILGCYAEST